MQLIKNNPYRTVGLLVGATLREQDRQINRLKQFIETEQEPDEDFSFPTLGNLNRTINSVDNAAAKLNLDSDKMNAALFWFYKGNSITDEPAFDLLKEGQQQDATTIWTKLIDSGVVTQRNSSAFHNLSTLLLYNAFNDSSINTTIFEQGISLKLKFLESDFVNELKERATDITYKKTKKELQLLFLNQVQSEIDKNGDITLNKFIEILNKQYFSAKEYFLKGFVKKPIRQIENKIEESKTKRKANKANAVNIGKTLYEQTSESLSLIKSILGTSNIRFSSISDKVSNEILQCGIDYFYHYRDSNIDPEDATMDLFQIAKTLAIGNIAKQRCYENMEKLQEMIDNEPIDDALNFIKSKLVLFQNLDNSINNALNLANSCKPYLDSIKLKLGKNNDLYLKISTAVAINAQGMVVLTINEATNEINYYPYHNNQLIINYKNLIKKAWKATINLGSFDMYNKQRENYNKNKYDLKELYKKLNDNVVFFGDTPVQKWILWVAGIGLFFLLTSIFN